VVNFLNIEVKCTPKLNYDLICSEYQRFKFTVKNSLYNKETSEIFEYFFINSESYPEIQILLEFAVCIALRSVECERVFSRMKLIKTPLRNQMKEKTLDSHLNISLNYFVFERRTELLIFKAIEYWKSLSSRTFANK
jgi:hypothetical protein